MHVGTGAIAFSLFIRHSHPCDRTAPSYSSSQLREVQSEKPNHQPLPFKGRGVRIKASLLQGERFGERSTCRESLQVQRSKLGRDSGKS